MYPFALTFLLSAKHFIEEVQKFAPFWRVTGVDAVLSGYVVVCGSLVAQVDSVVPLDLFVAVVFLFGVSYSSIKLVKKYIFFTMIYRY